MGSLIELAERCEAVTDVWNTADLNADIYEALGYSVIRGGKRVCWRYRGHGPFGFESHWSSQRRFTRKIDDAAVLVPVGFYWSLDSRNYAMVSAVLGEGEPYFSPTNEGQVAITPALALCAAALRSRATMEASNG